MSTTPLDTFVSCEKLQVTDRSSQSPQVQITTGSAKLDHLLKGGVETGQITEAGFGNRKGEHSEISFFLGP